ncbi:cupin domain-containing protein [Bradyrhizobium sp. USDA 3256]
MTIVRVSAEPAKAGRTKPNSLARLAVVAGSAMSLLTSFMISSATAQSIPKEAVLTLPDKLVWKTNPRTVGTEIADIIGDSTKAGPFIQRVKFPANYKMAAHTHPEDRTYTVISGMWYVGYGDHFDESKLVALPPGSFYVEPANVPHFAMTKGDDVVYQLTGTGPSATIYVEPPFRK